jgi:ubiquinone biosynthesis protein
LNRYLFSGVGHLDVAGIITSGMNVLHQHGLVLPADLSLLFRVMLELQGIGRDLGTDVRVGELLQPYLAKLLAERFAPRHLAQHAVRTLRGWDRLAGSLPADIEEIVRQIRAGKLAVDFRVHDAEGAVDHLVDGLVAAASVLASAELTSRRSGPMIGPVSAPGLLTAGVGVLTWQRLVRRRREHKTWLSGARELKELQRGGATS